jgi:hypothetical protein
MPSSQPKKPKPHRPAMTPEGRENQLISLAYDRAEKQMREGTASSQVITHFLKMGSTREKLEQQRLQHENLLLSAKRDQIASSGRMEELYSEAIKVMKVYSGQEPVRDDADEDVY